MNVMQVHENLERFCSEKTQKNEEKIRIAQNSGLFIDWLHAYFFVALLWAKNYYQ